MNKEQDDILEMSDEEFMKQDPATFEQASTTKATEEGAGDKEASADDNHQATDEGKETNIDTPVVKDDDDDEKPADAKGKDDPEDLASTKADDTKDDKVKSSLTELTDTDYVNIGKQIMTEFKANGTVIKIKNVDDAIQLMQMGANYHKKMAGLKPSLKALKLLENNGLLDTDKINYLIDLSQKKPEAITQLFKDSKIDPMNVDLTGTNEYVPQHRSVSDTEILLDEVLDNISHSPAYNRTLTVLGDEWDTDSRALLAKTPEVIQTINSHIENGIYDQVAKSIAYERSLGKLVGVNDYEAYQRVGQYMHENNLFVSATVPNKLGNQHRTPADTSVKDAADAADAAARAERKKAASPSRSGKVADEKVNYNPLAMSDEEFIKLNKLNI